MKVTPRKPGYPHLIEGITNLLETARRTSARAVNALMTATYWEVGRRIVEFDQQGRNRAGYGDELLEKIADDLTQRLGRGFSRRNLISMRQFYRAFPAPQIRQTLSAKSSPLALDEPGRKVRIRQTVSAKSKSAKIKANSSAPSLENLRALAARFPLPWSHYVLLVSRARSPEAVSFYHTEALRGGWSVRQLDRQIAALFYERVALSKNKSSMLKKGAKPMPAEEVSADVEIRHPLVLEFLNLKDEYSESDLEEALVRYLEKFLLELGGDFAFVGRQRRLRIGDEWYRVDLLFFHRRLRCLIVIDLKLGKFTHADAGQMHLYLNYAREQWMQPGENPPVGLLLCTSADEALAKYALEGLSSKVLAREYHLALPKEKLLAAQLGATRKQLESRQG